MGRESNTHPFGRHRLHLLYPFAVVSQLSIGSERVQALGKLLGRHPARVAFVTSLRRRHGRLEAWRWRRGFVRIAAVALLLQRRDFSLRCHVIVRFGGCSAWFDGVGAVLGRWVAVRFGGSAQVDREGRSVSDRRGGLASFLWGAVGGGGQFVEIRRGAICRRSRFFAVAFAVIVIVCDETIEIIDRMRRNNGNNRTSAM